LEHYDKLGVDGVITLGKDQIMVLEEEAELKLGISDIEQINEIQDYIFIKSTSGESVIVPKGQIDAEKFMAELKAITKPKNIPWNSELKWRWR
jgi:pantothenate kinase